MTHLVRPVACWLFIVAVVFGLAGCKKQSSIGPVSVVAAPDGQRVWVACKEDKSVIALDVQGRVKWRVSLTGEATGLALRRDARQLAVTFGEAPSSVCLLNADDGVEAGRFEAGHSANAPVFSADGTAVFVCDRFRDQVFRLDRKSGQVGNVVRVLREPVAAALTPDGRELVVANHLHVGDGGAEEASACVTIIDAIDGKVKRHVKLANGAGLLLGVAISPDGKVAAVTHNLARFKLPTTQVERGWICSAAVSLLSLSKETAPQAIVLDNVDSGAANPWAITWTEDGGKMVITHAGTHEVSVIDYRAMAKKLEERAAGGASGYPDPAADLSFLLDVRRRVPLMGNGPRALAVSGGTAWVVGYFSDTLEKLELGGGKAAIVWKPEAKEAMTLERRGEMAFNDARHCFQGWLSCASCHSTTGRVDGYNWDLLNDGIGNPKNAKSLLYSHRTPPTMSTGVRATAEAAVRAGFRHIQFAEPAPEIMEAVDAYLRSVKAVPSPYLENRQLSAAAKRGKAIFSDAKVGCSVCHNGEYFTDLNSYDVGTAGRYDPKGTALDTPTLREVWRTAPYLHDGSAATLREVFTSRNEGNRHGVTMHLTQQQIDDLATYVLSL